MIRSTLQLELASPQSNGSRASDSRRWNAWLAKVRRVLGPHVDDDYNNGDFVIDLDSPKLPALVEALEQLRKAKLIRRPDGMLSQRLVDDENLNVEWFEIAPDDGTLNIMFPVDRLAEIRADTLKPGVHFSAGHVSERVKALVEKLKLSGVEFLWLKDVGRYRAIQWFAPIVHRPLGRGLDHPWFDAQKIRRDHDCQPRDPRWRCGVSDIFYNDQFKPGAGFGDPVKDRLLSMFRRGGLSVWSFRHVLRRYLPETDFTFIWLSRDEEYDWNKGRFLNHSRRLCVNRRTKQLLVAHKLVSEEECKGVLVLDRAYRGAEVLDKRYPDLLGPLLSGNTLAQLRKLEANAWNEFQRRPKPARSGSLPRALDLLRSRKRAEPKCFARPAAVKAIEKTAKALGRPIPPAWVQVLRITNGFNLDACELVEGEACGFATVEELPKLAKFAAEAFEASSFEIPQHYLPVAETAFGDTIYLDTASQTREGDVPVHLISHETGEAERSWQTVAEFLEELFTDFTLKCYLEYVGGTSSKFWAISVAGAEQTVRFGRIGSKGQTQIKAFKDVEAAERDALRQIERKKAKGYKQKNQRA